MDLFELLKKLKEEFHFKSVTIHMGYSHYESELYNLTFDYGASNGDRYYILKHGVETLIHEDLSPFSKQDDDYIIYERIYTVVRNFVRKKKIENLL